MKILGFLKSISGCDWYRCEQPLIHLRASKKAEVRLFHKGNDVTWFGTQETADKLEKDFEWADVIFVPRLAEGRLVTVMSEFRKMGKRIVTDWDDNFFKVSPLTQQYHDFGLEDYSHALADGEKLEVWKDGKNIDLDRNREIRKAMVEGVSFADMLIVTTEELAEAYAPYAKNIRVCPNSVNINFWKKLPLQPHLGLRMGWFGGDSHYEDWCVIAPVLNLFMRQNPNVTLVIMGAKFDATLEGIDSDRIEHHPWSHIMAYPYKAASLDLDFSIIPLKDNEFNRGKSPIKWLEMASLEVPAITSFLKPYDKMMDLVKDNGIFVENNDLQAWMEGMKLLVGDALLRKRMGVAARQTVERHFDANQTDEYWLKAFEEVMRWPIQPSRLQLVS